VPTERRNVTTTLSTRVSSLPLTTLRYLVLGVIVGVACWCSVTFTRLNGGVSTVWVANGLLTGVLLSAERRLWTGYFIAALAGNLFSRVVHGDAWYSNFGISLANILEAGIVVFALERFVGDLNNPAKFRLLGLVAVGSNLFASAISGLIAASILAAAGMGAFASMLGTWFMAHVLGMAIFATLTGVALRRGRRLFGRPGQRLEYAITLGLLAAVCLGVFTHSRYTLSFLIFPPLLYCIFRNGFDGVVLGIIIIVVISMTLTVTDNESAQLVAGFGIAEDALLLQLFLAVVCLVAFPIAIVLTESRFLTRGLRESERRLEQQNLELQALNDKLVGTQNQLLQSEKMASVGQLAAGVAHEINNPIGFVSSNLRTLTDYLQKIFSVLGGYEQVEEDLGGTLPQFQAVRALKQKVELDYVRGDAADLLAESLDGAMRVEKIVRDLRDFAQVEAAEWQLANVHDGIDSTLNVVAHELKGKCEVVKQYGDLPPIRCQPMELKQVFLNLLINAAEAIEHAGTITIATGRDDNSVWITIADTGHGIDPDHINRVFEPFFTTKPVGAGTGLGLSVSYGIIKKHGGSLEIASAFGKGTTLTIRLPINAPAASPSEVEAKQFE